MASFVLLFSNINIYTWFSCTFSALGVGDTLLVAAMWDADLTNVDSWGEIILELLVDIDLTAFVITHLNLPNSWKKHQCLPQGCKIFCECW